MAPVVVPAQPAPYDPSIPLFANPRPGVFVPVTLPVASGGGVLQPSLTVGARLFGRLHPGLGFGLTGVSLGGGNASTQTRAAR